MKFLLDENIPPSLADDLIRQGFSAIHAKDANLISKPDQEIFMYALNHDLILITHDLDFGRIHAFSGENKPSVILFRMETLNSSILITILSAYLKQIEEDLIKGAFVVIEEEQIRIRLLPIKNL